MEKYISESLSAGLIRPSSSPLGAGFFLIEKKDQTLHPCIEFRGLSHITVKNNYPYSPQCSSLSRERSSFLNLISAMFATWCVFVRGNEWKTAEKFAFHQSSIQFLGHIIEEGQIKADLLKIKAVADFPTPTDRKQLQKFLWFTNLLVNHRTTLETSVAPLTCLTFSWPAEGFWHLKTFLHWFCTDLTRPH